MCRVEGVEVVGKFEHRVEWGVFSILDKPELGQHQLPFLVPQFLKIGAGCNTGGIHFFEQIVDHPVEVVYDVLIVYSIRQWQKPSR